MILLSCRAPSSIWRRSKESLLVITEWHQFKSKVAHWRWREVTHVKELWTALLSISARERSAVFCSHRPKINVSRQDVESIMGPSTGDRSASPWHMDWPFSYQWKSLTPLLRAETLGLLNRCATSPSSFIDQMISVWWRKKQLAPTKNLFSFSCSVFVAYR